jgi:arsenate reductase
MSASVFEVVEVPIDRTVLPEGLLRSDAVLPARLLQRRLLLMAERTVLFVCVENAARSLMAEAFFNAHAPDGWRAVSAGTSPASTPNPRTAPMLREVGIEPPGHPPAPLTLELLERAAVRVTMGCLDSAQCPARLRELTYVDWALEDPARLDDAGFRRVRDEVRAKVGRLAASLPPA